VLPPPQWNEIPNVIFMWIQNYLSHYSCIFIIYIQTCNYAETRFLTTDMGQHQSTRLFQCQTFKQPQMLQCLQNSNLDTPTTQTTKLFSLKGWTSGFSKSLLTMQSA
jgi:hypothetical protein